MPRFPLRARPRPRDGEVLDAEEIEFKKTRIFHRMHVVLGDELAGLGIGLERRPVGERRGRDDDARGVHARVPDAALDPAREVDDLARLVVFVIERFSNSGSSSSAWSMVMGKPWLPMGISLAMRSPVP
jgi:hypothetical protein